MSLTNLILTLPSAISDSAAASFAPELAERALAFSALRDGNDHRGAWRLTWLFEAPPVEAEFLPFLQEAAAQAGVALPAWVVEPVVEVNWLEQCYRQFQPFAVDEFFIYGSHYTDAPPGGTIPLQIDAATAFGSGEHGTTAGCLRALLRLRDDGFMPARVLDMGTGSGILAIAAAKLWPVPVLAVDIEEEAVVVTDRHATLNRVKEWVTAVAGDGFATKAVADFAPYSLILANILAGPLVAMAADLVGVLAPDGAIVLSGMLREQTADVVAAYQTRGCKLIRTFSSGDWDAVLLRRSLLSS